MDTINSMAKAAATAVWGENSNGTNKQEPVSGAQGDVSKGEPFDKGNADYTQNTADSAQFAKNSGKATESDAAVPSNPSTDLKEKRDGPEDTSKGQNDTRDPTDPNTHPKDAPTDVDNTNTNTTDKKGDDGAINEGQKLDGPGPAPLEEVAKKHGGDAGNHGGETKNVEGGDGKPAGDDEDKDGPGAKSTGEGTGEKYIKSTGLAVDGGDFDASNAGAGREADRLLEEKGITHDKPTSDKNSKPADTTPAAGKDTANTTSTSSTTSTPSKAAASGGEKEKKSLKDKIKEKFSRNKDE